MKRNFNIRPENHGRLHMAVLTTFEFEPDILSSLPFTTEDSDRVFLFCGEGLEQYPDPPEGSDAYACLNRIRIPVQFAKGRDGLSAGYLHAKILLLEYMEKTGESFFHLVIQSANLTSHDNLETAVEFTGTTTPVIQEQAEPLIHFLEDLMAYIPAEAGYKDRREQMEQLIHRLSYVAFKPADAGRNEDWSFLYGDAIRETLFQSCDEMIAVCPFIQEPILKQLTAAAGTLTVVSGTPMIMRLLKHGIPETNFVPISPNRTYLHAKLYLRRTGSVWQILSGSANLTDYSLNRNMEFMEMHSGSYEAEDIQRWLADFLPTTNIPDVQRETDRFSVTDSKVFVRAAQRETRFRYLQKVLNQKKISDRQKERIVEYVLSNACVRDLKDFLYAKAAPAVPEPLPASNDSNRRIFHYPFRDKILLELLNESIHTSFDSCFSSHVYSHIRGRRVHDCFTLIRNTPQFKNLYLYKTDISKFDPSIPEHVIRETLRKLPGMDPGLLGFLETVTDTDHGKLPAVKTGCPLNGFFENAVLREVDSFLEQHAFFYVRFADDILIGMKTEEERNAMIRNLKRMLGELGLTPNEAKSVTAAPGESLTYLGWKIENGKTEFTKERLQDIKHAILQVQKQQLILLGKNRMDRMFRLYLGVTVANRLEKQLQLEQSFKVVSKTDGLKQIDRWISDMIRTLASGKTGKGKYRISRRELHRWGYRTLVVRYYDKISMKR